MKFASMGPGSPEGSSETHTVVDSSHVTLLVLLAAEQLSHHRLGTYLEQLSEARPKFIGSCNDWIWDLTLLYGKFGVLHSTRLLFAIFRK